MASVSEIIGILRQQSAVYEALLELEKKKTPVIVRNDLHELNAITAQERKWTAEAQRLEKERIRLTTAYVVQMGLPRARSSVLTSLIKAVTDAKEKEALTELHAALRGTLQQLKFHNDTNKQLMEQSLDFIRFSLDLLVDNPHEHVVYQHPMNRTSTGPGTGMFNKRY
ncbi:flagellar protein FlgN [Paenibacillus thailandensis]|uniref:Flagellar protein FlgN n=1 Tax=Paenibacillus thailandensis TaxID=393250 RepID=A0ABW5R2T2_9BACL